MTRHAGDITVIITAFRRPHTLARQFQAIRAQTVPPQAVWIWANDPNPAVSEAIAGLPVDRLVVSRPNAFFHARFALAQTALTEYVAVFDDDSIPGERWSLAPPSRVTASRSIPILGNGIRAWWTPSP